MSTKFKSCKLDPIPTTSLKKILPCLLPTITKIINLSLQSGIFPRSWKTAIVTPLLKKQGMELVTSNYRPVSNLPYISKFVEKAMFKQINHTTVIYITCCETTSQDTERIGDAKQYC